jgi:hypothetical protein
MKLLTAAVFLYALVDRASAFSAVAPKTAGTTPSFESVDRSMKGIDSDNSAAFDPTEGENAALTRNNKGEVWVSQVRKRRSAKDVL